MNDFTISEFRDAIQATHGARSRLAEQVQVTDRFKGKTVWEGEVMVFELLDHPTAPKCYCWEVDARVTCVLHESPVDSPLAAVRAAIVADSRER